MGKSRTLLVAAVCAALVTSSSCATDGTAPVARAVSTEASTPQVLVISVDGLNPSALHRLGPEQTPALHRLIAEGATTLNARSQVTQTTTLPNHTSMVTGRPIARKRGGHGVTWNHHRPGTTVQEAAGHGVGSIFSILHKAGLDVALFAAKKKFSIFDRSWPGIDRVTIRDRQDGPLVRALREDLAEHERAFTFLHVGGVDKAGHDHGFMSKGYLDAVRRADARIGAILRTIDDHAHLADLTVVLTADHGGRGENHDDPTRRANYRVPFIVWGPDVTHDNLYDLNPTFKDPGRRRVWFSGEQPIRNGDIANLSATLLGLGPVPGSLWNHDQQLRPN